MPSRPLLIAGWRGLTAGSRYAAPRDMRSGLMIFHATRCRFPGDEEDTLQAISPLVAFISIYE